MSESPVHSSGYSAAVEAAIVSPASDLGVLSFEGDDSASFLHGQLSSDVEGLAPGRSQWSTYNGPKGRALATMRLWRDAGGSRYGALIGRDLAAPIAKRLSLYVLRSKVRIGYDVADVPIGVGGPHAADAIESALDVRPLPDGAVHFEGGMVVGLGDRYAIVCEPPRRDDLLSTMRRHALGTDENVWRWLGIRSGVPIVGAATSDRFVPQMLNFDALDGISFDKGCYPGQEVVARTRFLGQLKERLHALQAPAPVPAPGTRIFSPAFGDQPCGTVVNAAPGPNGEAVMLAVIQIAAVQSGALALDATNGPALSSIQLPYATPQPERRARVRL